MKPKTPFPWMPMVAIAICLVAHAYALCSLFPYVGYMVQHLGVTGDKDEAGKFASYYAGYLSSALMIGRVGGSYFWGRFADRYGRMPVMYSGLLFIAVLSIGFGFSTNFFWAVTFRFLAGALNGIMGNAKTMICEVCGSEHEVVGMSFVTGCWSVGLVLGSALGGLLAEPATHYPTMFSESGLFGRYPYLLPNVFGAALSLMGLPLVYFFLEETHDALKGSDSVFSPLVGSALIRQPSISVSEIRKGLLWPSYVLETEGKIMEYAGKATRRMSAQALFVATLSGCRHGFEPVPTAKADLHIQEVTADKRGGIKTTRIDISYDPQLANGGGGGATSGSGGKIESETVGKKRSNGSSAKARADERLPLAPQPLKSSSRARELEGGEMRSVQEAGSGGETWGEKKTGAFLRECLVPFRLLAEQRVRSILLAYSLFSFLIIGSQEVYPLWALSTFANGGLDWTTRQIGQTLAVCGGGMLIFQLFVYPRVVERIGATRSQRWSCCVTIPVYLSYPLLSMLHDSGEMLVAASVVVLFFTSIAANAVLINVSLATNNAVHPSQRGTINGLSMAMGALAKAAGPIVSSTVFAWSINGDHPFPFDCHLIFCIFSLGMVVVTAMTWNIDISPAKTQPE
ncbi:unnamed protein product, partial [Laminaria digitata]